MKWLGVLVSLSLACAGASQAPRRSCPECPAVAECPTCKDDACLACPERADSARPVCPRCPSPYADTEGWYCIDDPAVKGESLSYSYCWSTQEDCGIARKEYLHKRSTIGPCRPQSPVYCFHEQSVLTQIRRYFCSATLEHCENARKDEQAKAKPKLKYTFSPCTEHP